LILPAMVVAVVCACAEGEAPTRATAANREQALRIRLDEVDREDFLLAVDEAGPAITLFLGRVPLQRYEVLSIERAQRRLLFFPLSPGPDPAAVLWKTVAQDPPAVRERRELAYAEPGDDGDDASPEPPPAASRIPPTPEQAVPALDHWILRAEGGPELWFEAVGPDVTPVSKDDGAVGRWQVFCDWVRGGAPVPRLRIRMPREHAHFLYRSLPTDAALLILPVR
jgi:hypothetical protein